MDGAPYRLRPAPLRAVRQGDRPPGMLRLVSRFLPDNPFMRRLMLLASSTAAAQAVLILVSPILTRLYGPEDFGYFTVFTTLLGIFGTAACLRYEAAVPICRNDGTAALVVRAAVLAGLAMALLLALVLWLAGGAINAWLELPEGSLLLWWLPVGVAASGVFFALDGWALKQGTMRVLALSKLWQSTGQAALQLGLWVLGPAGLVAGYILGYVAGLVPILRHMPPGKRRLFRGLRARRTAAMAWRYRRFPFLGTGAIMLNSTTRLLPALLLAVLYGPVVAGWYGLAQRVVGIPIRLIGIAASQVYTAESASLQPHQYGRLYPLFMATAVRLALLGTAWLGGLALAGPWVFALVFGSEWWESGELVRLLFPMYLAMFVMVPIAHTLNLFERQDLVLALDLFSAAVLAGSFAAGWWWELGYGLTVGLYSAGMAISYSVYFLLARRLLRAAGHPDAGTNSRSPTQ